MDNIDEDKDLFELSNRQIGTSETCDGECKVTNACQRMSCSSPIYFTFVKLFRYVFREFRVTKLQHVVLAIAVQFILFFRTKTKT